MKLLYPQKPIEEKVRRGKGRIIVVEFTAGEAEVFSLIFQHGIFAARKMIRNMPKVKQNIQTHQFLRCIDMVDRICHIQIDLQKEARPV